MSKLNELIAQLCPDGVVFSPIKEICISLKKGTLKTEELLENGDFPVINAGRDFYGYYSECNNEGNAITIASRGEYAGFAKYIDEPFWAGGLCYPYRSKNEKLITTKFIFYYIKSQESYIMDNLVSRGSIPAINKGDVENFLIPIPPIKVQEEIVRILDNFTELTAELTENLAFEIAAREKQYNYYCDTLLERNIPVERVTLGSVCEVYDGTHQTPEYTESGIPFVSVEDIDNLHATQKFISEEAFAKFKIKPRTGDVFMTRITAGIIGKCAVVDNNDDLAYYVSLALLRPNHSILNSKYLKHYLESRIGRTELAKRILWNATPTKINKIDIGKLFIAIPPLDVQERIVRTLDKADDMWTELVRGLPAEIEARQKQYEHYRDKLLTFTPAE